MFDYVIIKSGHIFMAVEVRVRRPGFWGWLLSLLPSKTVAYINTDADIEWCRPGWERVLPDLRGASKGLW